MRIDQERPRKIPVWMKAVRLLWLPIIFGLPIFLGMLGQDALAGYVIMAYILIVMSAFGYFAPWWRD